MSEYRLIKAADIERNSAEGWVFTRLHPGVTGAKQVMLGLFSATPGTGVPPHHHTCETIAYLVRGRAVIGVGDQRLEMEPGDCVYVAAGVVHTEETIGDEDAEFILARDNGGGETIPADPEDPFWNQ